MGKLAAFVRMDFMTIKPYFTFRYMMIYVVLAFVITVMSADLVSGIAVGMLLTTNFISYPFAVGEKSNLDALYTTMSLDRRSVVFGRYIFTLALNLCAIAASLAVAMLGVLATQAPGQASGVVASPLPTIVFVLASIIVVIQSIQLPIFFKLSYSKAKMLSLIPFIGLMLAFLVINLWAKADSGIVLFLNGFFDNAVVAIPIMAGLLAVLVFASYQVSRAFYSRREF